MLKECEAITTVPFDLGYLEHKPEGQQTAIKSSEELISLKMDVVKRKKIWESSVSEGQNANV